MVALSDGNSIPIPVFGPASKLLAITPSDATDLTSSKIRALWIGAAGNVAVIALNDTAAVTLVAATAGQVIPIQVAKVMSTNTTATSIVGMS